MSTPAVILPPSSDVLPASVPESRASVARLLDAFMAGRSPHTMRAYKSDLRDFSRFLHEALNQPPAHVGTPAGLQTFVTLGATEANAIVLRYRGYLRERAAPKTVNRRLASVRSLVKVGRLIGAIAWTVEVGGVRNECVRDTRGPSSDDAVRLLAHVERVKGRKGRRDYAMARLMLDLALRCSEVVQLECADLDTEHGTLMVRGKGRYGKTPLTVPPQTLAALNAWLRVRGTSNGLLFTRCAPHQAKADRHSGIAARTLHRLVSEWGAAVGLRTWPHALRHTAISTAVAQAASHGLGLDDVLPFSRHESVDTLLLYRDAHEDKSGEVAKLVALRLTPARRRRP